MEMVTNNVQNQKQNIKKNEIIDEYIFGRPPLEIHPNG